jgi:hypothetical protein
MIRLKVVEGQENGGLKGISNLLVYRLEEIALYASCLHDYCLPPPAPAAMH